ncbi:NAD(P)-dependent oxidoreductase [Streptomyces sp. RKAG293]|uniref:NAD(P)-dependent oxidoreductase n=1 Tax=Streptomyces sp. RKAG293 TaxID=2893403 RepID=UPI002033D1C1|nr:NAD(P)-dependent oxidoreductase [Streptomyces sp. RKAG293]MCM2419231.1 NAD(P)-dependent oxidoreductase [Streptomyces sp. RKAG293]
MDDTLSVAVLGTGLMGAGMARNLAAAGLEVRAWNRTLARAEPLAAAGVHITGDPVEAVRGADAVVTMLLDGPSVLRTMREASPGLREGVVWAQMCTVGPDALAPLAALARERGAHFVDAPVLGTRSAAEAGRLTVLAAGPEAARPVAGRVFDAVGRKVLWLGDDGGKGTASSLKLVLNSWVLAVTNGAAEAMALAKGLDVDPRNFFEALDGGPLDLPYLRLKAEAMLSGDFAPNFTVDGALKDARLIVAAGEAHGVQLDVAAAGAERFSRAAGQGHGGEDMAASYFASFDT